MIASRSTPPHRPHLPHLPHRPHRVFGALAATAFAGVLVMASSACKKDDGAPPGGDLEDPLSLVEDGTDTNATEGDLEVVTSSLVSATASGGSLTLASSSELAGEGLSAADVGDGAKALYFPRDCLTVASDLATQTVTYAFAGCAGPNGIFRITGTVVVTYTVAAGTLTLNLVGTDLSVNRATLDATATAAITASGADRSMRWSGSLSGVTARGRSFTRTTDKTVTWRFGERCFGLNGASEGNVRDRYVKTVIEDFRRCQGACPEAGGKITISNAAAEKIELTFDGTSQATFTSSKGTSTVALACSG